MNFFKGELSGAGRLDKPCWKMCKNKDMQEQGYHYWPEDVVSVYRYYTLMFLKRAAGN
jgi:hypothetical protein